MPTRRQFLITVGALAAAGCTSTSTRPDGVKIEHPGFPYHPLVYHLDLAILAYQLYGQSLVFPFDPYYEEMVDSEMGRQAFMQKVWAWAKETGAEQSDDPSALTGYRGPGVLGSFPNNIRHDPILYRYGLVYPWSDCLNYPGNRWVLYRTPKQITKRIKEVYVSTRRTGGSANDIVVEPLPIVAEPKDRSPDAADVLLCFEGGTGDKGEAGQPHSHSLMGCVLLRRKSGKDYDVHVALRGSRSGSGGRALLQALSDRDARGNPDWITDMGFNRVSATSGGLIVTSTGEVSRGFTRSMGSILPRVFGCFEKIAELAEGVPPKNIYVTGHSLGGALAQHFVSAILLGGVYGPGGAGRRMPSKLKSWPWRQIKLVTFSAPRAGGKLWARTLTEEGLKSEFFSSVVVAADSDALSVTDETIVPRLLDPDRPAGYRILISTDPITTEKVGGGGKHVGKTVYVDEDRSVLSVGPDVAAHEVTNVRKYMTDSLQDDRVPKDAWEYKGMAQVCPKYVPGERGKRAGMEKLAAGIRSHYADRDVWFNREVADADFAVLLELLKT